MLRRPDVLGEAHPGTLTTKANIAGHTGALGRHDEALALFQEVWEVERRPDVLGEEHPHTLTTKANIALQTSALGHHAEALTLFREVWESRRNPDVLGEKHPDTLNVAVWIAYQDGLANDPAEALAAFDKAASAEVAVLGPDDALPLRRRAQRAHLQALAGDREGAVAEAAEVRAAILVRFAPTHYWLREIEQWTTDLGLTLPA